ncbi:hypothetical protein [Paenibacillus silvae]|uniref:hypothetical protein n=1 Tax=Paenibacillus silvae TaxID=1325358 RepID=UPI0020044A58|nr:hypothetical protein [Paenibacillus silvae]MCK6148605.1 hypothetical protein [Paenibacillus silvae]
MRACVLGLAKVYIQGGGSFGATVCWMHFVHGIQQTTPLGFMSTGTLHENS